MRTHLWVALTALAVAGWAGWAAGAGIASVNSPNTAPPPPLLALEEDEPLLLEEPAAHGAEGGAIQAQHDTSINARCYVCHVNFKQDPFVQWHVNKNIGCVKCHGESREHIADEANLTPPEVMYWPSRVGFGCYWCHPRHDVPARDVLARWHELGLDQAKPQRVLCTECHGAHRLRVRTIVWDKRTGALLSKTQPMAVQSPPKLSPPISGVTNGPAPSLANQSAKDER
jgi:hypothetical protein